VSEDATMEPRIEQEAQLFAAERLAFFTDAVVAIAMTLLALDLRPPEGNTWSEVWESVGSNADTYLAFLISFFIIANAWVSHHALFRYVTRADAQLLWTNLLWQLMVVVAPFVTRMIVDDKVFYQFRFVCYAAVQVLLGLLLLRMVRYSRRAGLLMESTPPVFLRRLVYRSLVVVVPFALSMLAVFVPGIGQNSYYLWLFGPPATAGLLWWGRRLRERTR
jgi:uncharacterized membrane protein